MNAGGKSSVASLLAGLMTVAWYVASWVLAVAVSCVVLSLIGTPGLNLVVPISFTVDAPAPHVTAPSLGIDGAEIHEFNGIGFGWERGTHPPDRLFRFPVRGSLQFPARRGAFLLANAVILVVSLGLVLWVVGQLRAVFRTVRDGHPFVPANASRIRWIGSALIAAEVARAAVSWFENYYALTHFFGEGLRIVARPEINILALINGLIILALAEVFRAGTRLDEEQSLTV